MKITIIYDNTTHRENLRAGWGFSALVEAEGRTILFDTGAEGTILLENMSTLGVDPRSVEEVFISHAHHDHMGGLVDFLRINPVRVILPRSAPVLQGVEVIRMRGPVEIRPRAPTVPSQPRPCARVERPDRVSPDMGRRPGAVFVVTYMMRENRQHMRNGARQCWWSDRGA